MKIRIGNTLQYIDVDVEHPYLLSSEEGNKQIRKAVADMVLFCGGCKKELKKRSWVSIIHRPKSAKGTYIEDYWNLFFICFDTKDKCSNKWMKKRKK